MFDYEALTPLYIIGFCLTAAVTIWLFKVLRRHARQGASEAHRAKLFMFATVCDLIYCLKFFISAIFYLCGETNEYYSFHIFNDDCFSGGLYDAISALLSLGYHACWLVDCMLLLQNPLRGTKFTMWIYHISVWVFTTGLAIAFIVQEGHQVATAHTCWVRGDPTVDATFDIPLMVVLAGVFVCAITICCWLRRGSEESREARNSMSKWFLVYASLFMLFWAWPFAHFAEEKDGDGDSTFSHVIQVGDATVVSLQGAILGLIRLYEPDLRANITCWRSRKRSTRVSHRRSRLRAWLGCSCCRRPLSPHLKTPLLSVEVTRSPASSSSSRYTDRQAPISTMNDGLVPLTSARSSTRIAKKEDSDSWSGSSASQEDLEPPSPAHAQSKDIVLMQGQKCCVRLRRKPESLELCDGYGRVFVQNLPEVSIGKSAAGASHGDSDRGTQPLSSRAETKPILRTPSEEHRDTPSFHKALLKDFALHLLSGVVQATIASEIEAAEERWPRMPAPPEPTGVAAEGKMAGADQAALLGDGAEGKSEGLSEFQTTSHGARAYLFHFHELFPAFQAWKAVNSQKESVDKQRRFAVLQKSGFPPSKEEENGEFTFRYPEHAAPLRHNAAHFRAKAETGRIKVIVYQAQLFWQFRQAMNLQSLNMVELLQPSKLLLKKLTYSVSSGASNSFFFRSECGSLLVKTVTKKEIRLLLGILPSYVDYMVKTKDSLLCKIYGCYTLESHGNSPTHLLVMGNSFALPSSSPLPALHTLVQDTSADAKPSRLLPLHPSLLNQTKEGVSSWLQVLQHQQGDVPLEEAAVGCRHEQTMAEGRLRPVLPVQAILAALWVYAPLQSRSGFMYDLKGSTLGRNTKVDPARDQKALKAAVTSAHSLESKEQGQAAADNLLERLRRNRQKRVQVLRALLASSASMSIAASAPATAGLPRVVSEPSLGARTSPKAPRHGDAALSLSAHLAPSSQEEGHLWGRRARLGDEEATGGRQPWASHPQPQFTAGTEALGMHSRLQQLTGSPTVAGKRPSAEALHLEASITGVPDVVSHSWACDSGLGEGDWGEQGDGTPVANALHAAYESVGSHTVVYRDMDFHRQWPGGLRLPVASLNAILSQVGKDVAFLFSHGLMDYSMILNVLPTYLSADSDDARMHTKPDGSREGASSEGGGIGAGLSPRPDRYRVIDVVGPGAFSQPGVLGLPPGVLLRKDHEKLLIQKMRVMRASDAAAAAAAVRHEEEKPSDAALNPKSPGPSAYFVDMPAAQGVVGGLGSWSRLSLTWCVLPQKRVRSVAVPGADDEAESEVKQDHEAKEGESDASPLPSPEAPSVALLQLGIIDFLQHFDFGKRMERRFKSFKLRNANPDISSVDSQRYAQRFINRLMDTLKELQATQ